MHYGDIDEMGQLHHPPKAVSAYTAFGTYSIVSYFVLFHEANIGKKSSAGLVPSWRSFASTMTFEKKHATLGCFPTVQAKHVCRAVHLLNCHANGEEVTHPDKTFVEMLLQLRLIRF